MKKCAAFLAVMLIGAWSLQSCDNGPTKEVWLDEFGQDSCYVQDWGMVEINRSVVHTPLTVNGVVLNVDLVPIPLVVCYTILVAKQYQFPVWLVLTTRTCLPVNFNSRFSVTRKNSGRVVS